MTDEPKGYVIWADGLPPDELKDGRLVLIDGWSGVEIARWSINSWDGEVTNLHADITRHARLE